MRYLPVHHAINRFFGPATTLMDTFEMALEVIETWPCLLLDFTSIHEATVLLYWCRADDSLRVQALLMSVQIIGGAESFSPVTSLNIALKGFCVPQFMLSTLDQLALTTPRNIILHLGLSFDRLMACWTFHST